MSKFTPKSFQQIVGDMAATLSANTPISDYSPGSVALTLLETAAKEDFQQYIQMLELIRAYNLDTTEGTDLDLRAAEYGLTRISQKPHSGFVTIKDSRFDKITTKIYAGKPGPTAGSTKIYVDDASGFPASGALYIGRTTTNTEGPISYSAVPVSSTSFWEITLDTTLSKDHGTDETVILSQFGSRVVQAGTEALIPENDYTEAVSFELNQTIELLDGENEYSGVLVTAIKPGGFSVPANSIISFVNAPFTGAIVNNDLPFVNGRDLESDQELRDRIRQTIQSLSRGTGLSVQNGIIGLIDPAANSSIVSANVVPPVNIADGPTKVYIDNGRGLEPSLDGVGLETLVTQATGGESFFQLQTFPIAKANVISQNIEPFSLVGSETIIVSVGTEEETFTFSAADFETSGSVTAAEISQAINARANLIEARTVTGSNGKQVIITPVPSVNDNLKVDSASTAQTALNFATVEVATLKLYKNDQLLVKDGRTASLLSDAQPFDLSTSVVTTTDSDILVTSGSKVVSKSAPGINKFTELLSEGDYIRFSLDSEVFYSKVKLIVSDTKLLLESAYPLNGGGTGNIVIWNSPQLEVAVNGDIVETEVISFSPTDFGNPAQALASEVVARLQKDLNATKSELAINNTKIKLVSNLENSATSKLQVLGGYAGLALGFNTTSAVNGALKFTAGSQLVQGAGTFFLSELSEGQWIKATTDNNGAWSKIELIESDTTLYLTEGYRGTSHDPGVAAFKMTLGSADVGQNQDYILNRSNGQIELDSPLVAGDSLTAGSINTRALVDSKAQPYDFSGLGSASRLVVRVDGGVKGTAVSSSGTSQFIASEFVGYPANFFVGFHVSCTSGNNAGQSDYITSHNTSTGQVSLQSGFSSSILPGDKFTLSQTIMFDHSLDFADASAVTAAEVATVINKYLSGGRAETKTNQVRLRTSNFEEDGSIQVVGGSANTVLLFSTAVQTNQISNISYVVSANSDKQGLTAANGYTISPNQTLAVILDGDNANKTFSIPFKIADEVTGGGSLGTLGCSNLAAKYPTNGYFNDYWVYWTSGDNEGTLEVVTGYVGNSGTFTTSIVFNTLSPSPMIAYAAGDEFALVPRTAENVQAFLNDLNATTISISGYPETLGVSGDYVQLSSRTPGSDGKVYVSGGTANSFGITVESVVSGSPTNDVTTNTKAGLAKGQPVKITIDGKVTTADVSAPYDTFRSTDLISTLSDSYFVGGEIEFLSGVNAGHKTIVSSYDHTTGEVELTSAPLNSVSLGVKFRISVSAFVKDIQGSSSPYTISLVDGANDPIDVSGFTPARSAAIRELNGFKFSTTQVEGTDGYKYYTGLVQLAQWIIDGLDTDPTNYPGLGAAGTQFEVITPKLKNIKLIINVTPVEGVSLSSISSSVSSAISQYVNSRKVGEDIILSEIIAAAQTVTGVFDVSISNHTTNITVADGELARISDSKLIIG